MLRLARRLPEFGVPTQPVGLAALYDASDDWVPIYDRSSLDGYFMACGTSGNQFKNAPLAGQFLRAIIDAADAGQDHDERARAVHRRADRPHHRPRRRSPAVASRRSPSGTVMG